MSSQFLELEIAAAPKSLTSDLYHYTRSDTMIGGILANRTIRLSPFSGTNDLWESRPFYPNLEGGFGNGEPSTETTRNIWESIDRHIRGHSKVACLTQDWELPESVANRNVLRGWAHLSLWAHYGEGHRGACLQFDRDRLLAAFENAQVGAIHQFSGPIEYHRGGLATATRGISLEQIEEFGVDAVALRFARVNRKQIFFSKHADWSSEAEFRLVRTDSSFAPYDLDIGDALTGIVLGEAFPDYQIPALRAVLAQFDDVKVWKSTFHNRMLQIFPVDIDHSPVIAPKNEPAAAPLPQPKRQGGLRQRLNSLNDAELKAETECTKAKPTAVQIVQMWQEILSSALDRGNSWSSMRRTWTHQPSAIPYKDRGNRPGVGSERIAFESGCSVTGSLDGEPPVNWTIAIALQMMPSGSARLHACVTVEKRRDEVVSRQELFRFRQDTGPVDLVNDSRSMMDDLVEVLPTARAKINEFHGTSTDPNISAK